MIAYKKKEIQNYINMLTRRRLHKVRNSGSRSKTMILWVSIKKKKLPNHVYSFGNIFPYRLSIGTALVLFQSASKKMHRHSMYNIIGNIISVKQNDGF